MNFQEQSCLTLRSWLAECCKHKCCFYTAVCWLKHASNIWSLSHWKTFSISPDLSGVLIRPRIICHYINWLRLPLFGCWVQPVCVCQQRSQDKQAWAANAEPMSFTWTFGLELQTYRLVECVLLRPFTFLLSSIARSQSRSCFSRSNCLRTWKKTKESCKFLHSLCCFSFPELAPLWFLLPFSLFCLLSYPPDQPIPLWFLCGFSLTSPGRHSLPLYTSSSWTTSRETVHVSNICGSLSGPEVCRTLLHLLQESS